MERHRTHGGIVVGVDGSNSAQRALHWAAEEAVRRGTNLVVLHAWSVPDSVRPDHLDPAMFEAAGRTILKAATAILAGQGHVTPPVRSLLIHDDAAPALLRAAQDAGLLVVGSRGRGGFVGLLLGSVSRRCVEHAPCPIAVVPSGSEPAGDGRVVVGVDGSQPSYDALHWAVAEAVDRNARLDVVNAYHYHLRVTPFVPVAAVDRDELDKASRALLEEMVAGALGRGEPQPPDVQLIACASPAARALLETADGADLLVVGSRGRGASRGTLLGSVSQQCVHHASCPVVVVHPRRAICGDDRPKAGAGGG